MVKVSVVVEKVKLVAIHPQNNSYPIVTAKVNTLTFTYNMLQDHDEMGLNMGNFRVFDNTNYPRTHDPSVTYPYGQRLTQ